ncbi:hypothetical protein NECAME_09336 [Necator americanus]|uniref:Uncharacterized protein n=1 Tax=Necator americanus TaxID=51031 RepID=W2TDN9_NECAM|nr:hypothetical protein NECAME_09336 [Necator americanus]ETN80170.1 hypothetical protein NECAME_09336 [Necator americanus]
MQAENLGRRHCLQITLSVELRAALLDYAAKVIFTHPFSSLSGRPTQRFFKGNKHCQSSDGLKGGRDVYNGG